MRHLRWVSLLVAFVLFAGTMAACGVVGVNPEKDRKLVLADVNGEKILKGELLDIYEQQKIYLSITDEMEKDPEHAENIRNLKEQILNELILEKLLTQKAEAAGFKITEEMRKLASEQFQELLESIEADMKAADESLGQGSAGIDYKKEAQDYVNSQLELMGKTQEEYIETMANRLRIEAFMEDTLSDIEASQEEIQNYYDSELQKQKEDTSYGDRSQVRIYRPESVRVKHITVNLPDEQQIEYNKLIGEGDQEAADAYLEDALKTIEPRAQEILDQLNEGKDFEELMKEEYKRQYGEEMPEMGEGLIIHKDTDGLSQAYKDAAFAIKEVNGLSGLVAEEYGYVIIKLYEKLPEKTFTLNEVKEDIKELVENAKKNEKWSALLDEWLDEVPKYTDRL